MGGHKALVEVANDMLHALGNERHTLAVVVRAISAAMADKHGGQAAATVWLASPAAEPQVSDHDPLQVSDHDPDVARRLLQATADLPGDGGEPLRLHPGTPAGAWLAQLGLGGAIVVPITAGSRRLGVLAVTRPAGTGFGDDDVELAMAVAAITAMTLNHGRILADSTMAMEELRRQGALLDYVSDAIVACDADGLILSWNAAAVRVYGYEAGEAIGCDLFALLATEFVAQDGEPVEQPAVLAEVQRAGRWEGELRERRIDGTPLIALSSITMISGDHDTRPGLVVVNRDITEQRRKEHLALHDELTGLPNRRELLKRLGESLARARRTDTPLAVLFLDLNGFKPINDRYGHATGDEVLQATADRLTGVLRQYDTAARLGGDEFVAVLENVPSEQAMLRILDRICAALGQPIGELGATVSASIGVVLLQGSTEAATYAPEDVLEMADEAMYQAKRNRTGFWIAGKRDSAVAVN